VPVLTAMLAEALVSVDARAVAIAAAVVLLLARSLDTDHAYRSSWARRQSYQRYANRLIVNIVATALVVAGAVPKETFDLLDTAPLLLGLVTGVGWAYTGTVLVDLLDVLSEVDIKLAEFVKAVRDIVLHWDVKLDAAASNAIYTELAAGPIARTALAVKAAALYAYPIVLAGGEEEDSKFRKQVETRVDLQVQEDDLPPLAAYGRALIVQEKVPRNEVFK
jgi:hypothetical protein